MPEFLATLGLVGLVTVKMMVNDYVDLALQRSHRSSRLNSSTKWTFIIRAWTVKRDHQYHGIGTTLLEETVRYARLRGLSGPAFAVDHAAPHMDLPGIIDSKFRDRARCARALLEYMIEKQKA
ncbi:hypothetical protein KEM54_003806 [Ascosphaera aggregata]|nr:hypothetical protein KEM54_003806 [Ascosphaera aggregata]